MKSTHPSGGPTAAPTTGPTSSRSEHRLRVLHLGFEDPLMPGAGGGSVRTHQINRRLATRGFDVTVLTTTYPGAEERTQDGVHYVPIGFGAGRNRLTRLLGYIARLPVEARRRRLTTDLVVEDFFAPFSSMAAPRWTGRPTIGMVQWLHAGDKSKQYRLPLHRLELFGVRAHTRLIAVSQGTADKLSYLNPRATVEIVGNGIDREALDGERELGRHVLFVGRLELHLKGLDLLLKAWATAQPVIGDRLIIAGTGPDQEKVERLVEQLGLSGSVDLVGWVSGQRKLDLMRSARLVVVPSRHETFGLVAVEALAGGTPVIIFDIPSLREVVPEGTGWRVPAFDAGALASELIRQYPSGSVLEEAGRAGREFSRQFDWDQQADKQATIYRDAVVSQTRSTP